MEEPSKDDNPQVLQVLQALKRASHDLQTHSLVPHSHDSSSSSMKALLALENESNAILSSDPNLSALSHHLTHLKNLVHSRNNTRGRHSLRSFLSRRVSTHSISRVAGSIESEIQAWIDRESVDNLSRALRDHVNNEDELVNLLTQFEERVSQGFNRELQDLVLKFKVFSSLESILCNPKCSRRIREHSGFAMSCLIRFNKDVFVGQVLMGPTIRALIDVGSAHSIEVLCSLIRSIKSPLVDEIESNGEIPKITGLLNCQELQMKAVGMDCVLEIGYFGRREAVEALLKEGLVEKLVELQRSEVGGDVIDLGRHSEKEDTGVGGGVEGKKERREKMFLESHPFASCVARFAVQLEIGEGLRQRERRAFKQEILVRVRKASASDAEAATIVAEVLWGSTL